MLGEERLDARDCIGGGLGVVLDEMAEVASSTRHRDDVGIFRRPSSDHGWIAVELGVETVSRP